MIRRVTSENDSKAEGETSAVAPRSSAHFVASSTSPTCTTSGWLGTGRCTGPTTARASGPGLALLVPREERSEQVRSLAVVDSPEHEQVGPRPEAPDPVWAAGRRWWIDAEADHDLRLRDDDGEQLFGDRALSFGVERQALRRVEHVLEQSQPDGGLVVRRGVEHGSLPDRRQTGHGRVVQVRRERDEIVVALADRLDQIRAHGSLPIDPVVPVRVADALGMREQREREASEVGIPLRPIEKPAHGHALLDRAARRVVVRPSPRVTCARREDLDRPALECGQPLGEQPCAELGPTDDVGAVAGRHEGELHESTGDIASRKRARLRSSVKSRRRRSPAATS